MDDVVHQGDDVSVELPGVSAASVLNRRSSQQDAFTVSAHMAAIADGMGGHVRGEEASTAALEALMAAVTGPCGVGELVAAAGCAQAAVAALADGEYRNPGTTLVAATVSGDGRFVHGVWCGDSRAWLIPVDGEASSLTLDHAYSAGGLFACLGEHGDSAAFRVDTFTVEAGHGHRVLLSTDGAHGWLGCDNGRVHSSELAELAASGVAEVVRVGAERGTDNATAVLIDIDTWVGASRPSVEPRPWVVQRRCQAGTRSVWIPELTVPATSVELAVAETALAAALVEWAPGYGGVEFAELAAAVRGCGGDVHAVRELLG